MIFTASLLISCLKLLLIPAYKSTDFEVHRNWLAITHNLPLKKWYFENTSEWTLDYPPLFGWFEYLLSIVAVFFDEKMLQLDNLNYASEKTVLFQRLSVIVTDIVYYIGVHMCCSALQKSWRKDVVLPILLISNCGLIMVDHIHFQYNGIMYGMLLISIAYMLKGKHLRSAFWFALLLNTKHIYIYLAPAYFIYLLRHHCIRDTLNLKTIFSTSTLKRALILGSVVVGVFVVTYLPFVDHLPQVLSRLFPFKRGLCHAYWAPNIWAIYNIMDKVGYFVVSRLSGVTVQNSTASMTGGLVQEYSHSFLPNITPIMTMVLTVIFMTPAMIKLFLLSRQPASFVRCMVVCALTSFLFGWHVHEKAILMAIIPLSILSIMETTDAKIFLVLSTVGHYSLFPLLYPEILLPVKVFLFLLYALYAFHSLYKIYPLSICTYTLPLLNPLESIYLLLLTLLFLYHHVIHNMLGLYTKLPFLPLMITSFYCSLGIVYCWISYYIYFLRYNTCQTRNKVGKSSKVE